MSKTNEKKPTLEGERLLRTDELEHVSGAMVDLKGLG